MSFISIQSVTKRFGSHLAVDDFSLQIPEGQFVSLLGGSGCGKTTTLRMLAGLEMPDQGSIGIAGEDVTRLAAEKRRVGMVFQNYALFPNLTVRQNVAFGLKVARLSHSDRETRVDEMLELVHLADFGKRYPHQLSGGQQQRVALARALAPKPRILLLDEPLSALDAQIRGRLGQEIRAIQQSLGITAVYVTHDQAEAMSLSDRIVIMNRGRIEQDGSPQQIYDQPANNFVAGFIGTLNLIPATVSHQSQGVLATAGGEVRTLGGLRFQADTQVSLGLRPENLRLESNGGGENQLLTTLRSVSFLGATVRLSVDLAGATVHVDVPNRPDMPLPATGAVLPLWFQPSACLVLSRE